MFPFSLAPETVDPACALLNGAGIPGQIVVDDMTTVPMEINSLAHNLAAHKNIGEERRIKSKHQPRANFPAGLTRSNLNIRHSVSCILSLFCAYIPRYFAALNSDGACLGSQGCVYVSGTLLGRTVFQDEFQKSVQFLAPRDP
jgi:hypothetical protein